MSNNKKYWKYLLSQFLLVVLAFVIFYFLALFNIKAKFVILAIMCFMICLVAVYRDRELKKDQEY